MKADLLLEKRLILNTVSFVEIRIWRVPKPVRASRHDFKYSLALVSENVCVMRYDNEAGKGDHKHIGPDELAYAFSDLEALQKDFWKDVEEWLTKNDRS